MANTTRSSRIELQVSPDEKKLIERAAVLSGSNKANFVRNTILAAAREVVQAHQVTELMTGGAADFVEVVTNPPESNENLRALAKDYQSATTDQEQGLRVVIEYAGENYGAYSPDLPGCVATGDTQEEVEANMREAIEFHIEGLMEESGFPDDPEARQVLTEAEAQIERGEGLSFEEAFGEELHERR